MDSFVELCTHCEQLDFVFLRKTGMIKNPCLVGSKESLPFNFCEKVIASPWLLIRKVRFPEKIDRVLFSNFDCSPKVGPFTGWRERYATIFMNSCIGMIGSYSRQAP